MNQLTTVDTADTQADESHFEEQKIQETSDVCAVELEKSNQEFGAKKPVNSAEQQASNKMPNNYEPNNYGQNNDEQDDSSSLAENPSDLASENFDAEDAENENNDDSVEQDYETQDAQITDQASENLDQVGEIDDLDEQDAQDELWQVAEDGVWTDDLADRPEASGVVPYYEEDDYVEALDNELTSVCGFLDETILFERGYGARIDGGLYQEGRELAALSDTVVCGAEFVSTEETGEPLIDVARVLVQNSIFAVERPLACADRTVINNCDFDDLTRGALCDASRVVVQHAVFEGNDTLAAGERIHVHDSEVYGHGFARDTTKIKLTSVSVEGADAFCNCSRLAAWNLSVAGNGAFRHLSNALICGSIINGDDALAYADNVTLRDCVINGSRIGWRARDLTLINCTLIGAAPLCRAHEVNVIDCRMLLADMAFEYSDVQAAVDGHINSVINPLSGTVIADTVGDVFVGNSRYPCTGLVYERMFAEEVKPERKSSIPGAQIGSEEEIKRPANPKTKPVRTCKERDNRRDKVASLETEGVATQDLDFETSALANTSASEVPEKQVAAWEYSEGELRDDSTAFQNQVADVESEPSFTADTSLENPSVTNQEALLEPKEAQLPAEQAQQDQVEVETINNLHGSVGLNRRTRPAGTSRYDVHASAPIKANNLEEEPAAQNQAYSKRNSHSQKNDADDYASLSGTHPNVWHQDSQDTSIKAEASAFDANNEHEAWGLASDMSDMAGEPMVLSPLDFMSNVAFTDDVPTFGLGEEIVDTVSHNEQDEDDEFNLDGIGDGQVEISHEQPNPYAPKTHKDGNRRNNGGKRSGLYNNNKRRRNASEGQPLSSEPSMEEYLANSYYATGYTGGASDQDFGYSGGMPKNRTRGSRTSNNGKKSGGKNFSSNRTHGYNNGSKRVNKRRGTFNWHDHE